MYLFIFQMAEKMNELIIYNIIYNKDRTIFNIFFGQNVS